MKLSMRHNRFYSGLLGVLLLVCGTAACGNNPAPPSSSEDTAAQSSPENTASTSSTETAAESAVTTQPETEEYDPNVLSKEEVQAIFA
jgi:cytoskeletal protein RodZ